MLVTGGRRGLFVDVCVVGQLGWENFEFWRKSFCFHLSRPFRSSQRWYSLKKVFLKFFPKLTGKPLIRSLFLISCTSLTACNFIKKRLQHRCFPVNFVKFLGTPFFAGHFWTTTSDLFPRCNSIGCAWPKSLKNSIWNVLGEAIQIKVTSKSGGLWTIKKTSNHEMQRLYTGAAVLTVFLPYISKFTWKHLSQGLSLGNVAGCKAANLLKRDSPAQAFSYEFFDVFQNSCF